MSMTDAAARNLAWLLRPVQAILDDPAMTDLYINGPGFSFVVRGQGKERVDLPFTVDDLEDIAINAAAYTRQDIAEDVPLVSTKFPGGHRVHIIRPPAVADGQFSFSVRQPSAETWTPDQLEEAGVFARVQPRGPVSRVSHDKLRRLYEQKKWKEFLTAAVRARLNIVFTGAMGSGKTHVMRSYTHAIPPPWRMATLEDTAEMINLPLPDVVHMFYSKGEQSVANVTPDMLVQASMRIGIKGLLYQELRDEAAHGYLSFLKSGHWSMTTTHADNAGEAYERIAGLVKEHKAGTHLDVEDIKKTLRKTINVVVHCAKEDDNDHRDIEQIIYTPPDILAPDAPTLDTEIMQ